MAAEATLRMILLGEDRSAGRTLKGVGDQADKSKSKLHGLSNVAGKLLAGGLLVAGAAAVKFARGAADDEKAAALLADTMHKAAGATDAQVKSTEKWITAQGKALGVSDDELRPALSKLVSATKDVGKAQSLASLAMDVAAGRGKSLGSVSEALAKAQNGNIGALGRLGIATKDADGKTKSLQDITKDLAATYGGAAAKAADTTAGKQKRLTVELSEAGETIGYKLLPFMLKMVDAGLKVLDWMGRNQKVVVILGSALVGLVTAVWAINAAARAYRATQLALNTVMSANPIALVALAVAALVIGLVIAYKKSETFRNIVDGAFRGIASAAKFMWEGVIKPAFKAWLNLWFTVVGAILDGAAKAFGWVPGIGGKLRAAADKFNDFRDSVNRALDGIHSEKTVHLTVTTKQIVLNPSMNKPRGANAVGTRFWAGGVSLVGERGPELVNLPRGSSVMTAADTSRLMSGSGGDAEGTFTIRVVNDMTGEQIDKKLVRVKRTSGRKKLDFELIS